jgi:hypothetical protein
MNAKWTHSVVQTLVSHPKYVGCNVFNQTTSPLGSAEIRRPRKEWVISAGAHQGIVDPATFAKAQEILASLMNRKTNDEILDGLRFLLKAKGRLSGRMIDMAPGMPCARTVWRRFGSVRKAFELIGYK